MSFGASPSDIFALIKLVRDTYCRWRDAYGELSDITSLLGNVKALLQQIYDVAEQCNILQNQRSQLDDALKSCEATLRVLNNVVNDCQVLGTGESYWKANWERLKLGNKQEDIARCREQISTHLTVLNTILTTRSLSVLDAQNEDLANILRYMRSLYEQDDANERGDTTSIRSSWTKHSGDDLEDWRELRRQLITQGFDSNTVKRHQASIQSYLQRLEENDKYTAHTSTQSEGPPVDDILDKANSTSVDDIPGQVPANFSSTFSLPLTQSGDDGVIFAGWVNLIISRLWQPKLVERVYLRLTGATLTWHASSNAMHEPLGGVPVEDYEVAVPPGTNAKRLPSAIRRLAPSAEDNLYEFLYLPRMGEYRRTDGLVRFEPMHPSSSNGNGSTRVDNRRLVKILRFSVNTRDERIEWMRQLMAAGARMQKLREALSPPATH